jgi:hypothetical protein
MKRTPIFAIIDKMLKVSWCKKLRSIERRFVLVQGDGSADYRLFGAEGFHDEVNCLPSTGIVGIYRPILLRKKT